MKNLRNFFTNKAIFGRSRFPVRLTYFTALASALSTCCLLRSIAAVCSDLVVG